MSGTVRQNPRTYQSDQASKSMAQRPGWESLRDLLAAIKDLDPSQVPYEQFGAWLEQRGVIADPTLKNIAWDAFKAYHRPGEFSSTNLGKNLKEAIGAAKLNPALAKEVGNRLAGAAGQRVDLGLLRSPRQDQFDLGRPREGGGERAGATAATTADAGHSNVSTPDLDLAIKALAATSSTLPAGGLRTSVDTMKSTLEAIRMAKKGGDPAKAAKLAADLGREAVEGTAAMVKAFAGDPASASEAASGLGAVAKVLGTAGRSVLAIDAGLKVVTGKDLSGNSLTKEARIEAAVDLVQTLLPPPLRAGVTVARLEAQFTYTAAMEAGRGLADYQLRDWGVDPDHATDRLREMQPTASTAAYYIKDILGNDDTMKPFIRQGFREFAEKNLTPQERQVIDQVSSMRFTADGTWRLNGRIVDPNVASPELMQQAAAHLRNLAIEWTQQSIARARNIKL